MSLVVVLLRAAWSRVILASMQNKTELSCPTCGGDSYSWGFVQGHHNLKYKDDDVGFLGKNSVFGGEPVKARKCNACGNIQLFVRE